MMNPSLRSSEVSGFTNHRLRTFSEPPEHSRLLPPSRRDAATPTLLVHRLLRDPELRSDLRPRPADLAGPVDMEGLELLGEVVKRHHCPKAKCRVLARLPRPPELSAFHVVNIA